MRSLAAAALAAGFVVAGCGRSGGLPEPVGLIDPTPGGDDPTPEEPTPQPPFDVCINEFMTENDTVIVDASGEAADWMELHNPSAATVSLDRWTLSDDLDEWDKHVFGKDVEIPAGGFLLLWADGDVGEGVDHLGFGLSRDGGDIVLADPYGSSSTIHYGVLGEDYSAARATDCCDEPSCWITVGGGSPGWSNEVGGTGDVVLLERGSLWRYLDSGVDPGASWTAASFDDSDWAEGFGPLGYNDSHIATSVDNGNTTTWFRATFEAEDPDVFDVIALRLLRDAGAAVYLNGVEAARSNLPDGPLAATTNATTTVAGQQERLYFPYEADPSLLAAGSNQVAVEVHRASGGGGNDLGFDLEILGR